MRHIRRMSAADVQAAADRAAADARPPALPVDAVRRAADRADRNSPPRRDLPRAPIDDIPF
ncbi:hypothetical protein [Methylobacterium indicum]|uniref:hypothetical protein n=1 Tax=Methylobacterium indicum TaxID=1775910 RepID=UPI000AD94BCC|nr:hypothetical protein [Methylobacterium indicum]